MPTNMPLSPPRNLSSTAPQWPVCANRESCLGVWKGIIEGRKTPRLSMSSIRHSFCAHGSARRPPIPTHISHPTTSLHSSPKPFFRKLPEGCTRPDVLNIFKNTWQRFFDAFMDSTFQFILQPILPSQSNFAPVDEIGDAVRITSIEGEIPADFPEGIYVRNGSNPLFGALLSTESPFGRSSEAWVEGDGMLHALSFAKDAAGQWTLSYKNRYVQSETFKLEKERNKPCFLPAAEGNSLSILAAYVLNQLRFGKVNKYVSNTNVFEHAGRVFSVAESHVPQEIDIYSLETYGSWDVDGAWDRPFTSHPKRAPGSEELVIFGVDAKKPFLVLGVVSADGKKLMHKVDLKLARSTLCHDVGVTKMYNIILDMPLVVDLNRLVRGGPLIKFEKESYARIGVMPRYGDADSIKWFEVEPYCTFHIVNCFETGDEVVVMGCRAPESIVPGPDLGIDKFQWFSKGFKPMTKKTKCAENIFEEGFLFSRLYEWRLNMKTGGVTGRYLTGTGLSIDFPVINDHFVGLHNKYAYTQVVDSPASSFCALPKYGSLEKLYLEEQVNGITEPEKHSEDLVKVEHHQLGRNQFCSGVAFVSKPGGCDEDDGWIVSFVHNEDTNASQVHIIDTKSFENDPIVKINLPQRVPYGFHGTFISKSTQC